MKAAAASELGASSRLSSIEQDTTRPQHTIADSVEPAAAPLGAA